MRIDNELASIEIPTERIATNRLKTTALAINGVQLTDSIFLNLPTKGGYVTAPLRILSSRGSCSVIPPHTCTSDGHVCRTDEEEYSST